MNLIFKNSTSVINILALITKSIMMVIYLYFFYYDPSKKFKFISIILFLKDFKIKTQFEIDL